MPPTDPDRVQLLLRLAMRLTESSDAADRRAILQWVSELLGDGASPPPAPAASGAPGPRDERSSNDTNREEGEPDPHGGGTQIYHFYKGQRYEAVLEPDGLVRFRGRSLTPSAAAMEITNNNVNGWRWWKYRAGNGPEKLIDTLR